MDVVFSIILGVGLAAACGFRVFIPLLLLSIGAQSGLVTISPDLVWIATVPALIAFAAATLFEILGYFIPWIDNALDALTTPAAVVAGVLVTAALVVDMDPLLRWSLAIIAGGGISGMVQVASGAARAASTAMTGGAGNHVLAAAEIGGSIILTVATLAVPILGGILVVICLCAAIFVLRKARGRRM